MTLNIFKIAHKQLKLRLKRAFGLPQKYNLEMLEGCQPSADVHKYLVKPFIDTEQKWITGNGWKYAFCCVPDNSRYYAIGINVEVSSGTFTFSRVALYDENIYTFFDLDYTDNKTTYSLMFPQRVIMEPLTINEVAVLITNHSVNGNLRVDLLVEEEVKYPI